MKVYLAGPINGQTDEGARGWRDMIKDAFPLGKRLNVDFIDPMNRDYRGVEDFFYPVIVERDKEDIQRCDVVVVACPEPSVGTSMEIFFAHSLGKKVITVVPDGALISPWLRAHSEIVLPDYGVAIEYLRRLAA